MDTRQLIIENAILALNENFSATFENIAISCGLNRRTLHRYFKNRDELLEACYKDMIEAWEQAAISVFHRYTDVLTRLEYLLYAAVDSGVKYTFLMKMNESAEYSFKIAHSADYLILREELFNAILELQNKKSIEKKQPLSWITILFTNMVSATVTAYKTGEIAPNEVKKLGWYSLAGSLDIQLKL